MYIGSPELYVMLFHLVLVPMHVMHLWMPPFLIAPGAAVEGGGGQCVIVVLDSRLGRPWVGEVRPGDHEV